MTDLARALRPAADCPIEPARALLDYWRALPRVGRWPDWRGVDKITLKPWMGWMVLYDVIDAGMDFRYRLVGAEIVERTGNDLTGELVSRNAFTEDNSLFLAALRELQAAGEPCWIDQPISTRRGTSRIYDRMCLPFANGAAALDLWLFYVCDAEMLVDKYKR